MDIRLIDFEKEVNKLESGTGILVPAGVRHRTNSGEPAVFLVFRHKQTACMLA